MKTSGHYILNKDGEPQRCYDLLEWAVWYEHAGRRDRIVKQETIWPSFISTVFLGLDHRWTSRGSPILWETMVFGGPLDSEQCRCSGSREQAMAMHIKLIKQVRLARRSRKIIKWAFTAWFYWLKKRRDRRQVLRLIKKSKKVDPYSESDVAEKF